jgi:HSP20 family protein
MSKGTKMAVMTHWDAFHDLRAAQDEMNYLNRMFYQGGRDLKLRSEVSGAAVWAPAVDITERKDAYLITAELPGVAVADVEIAFQDGLLTIQGERRLDTDPAEERTHLNERRYGAFRRSITLPRHVVADAIDASSEDGVLRVLVPKVEEAKPTRIPVHAVRAQTPAATDRPERTTS